MPTSRCLAFAASLLICCSAAAARPLEPADGDFHAMPYDAAVLACDDPLALMELTNRVRSQEAMFWESSLQIEAFEKVREIGFRSNGPEFTPRRFCSARARFNDGRVRQVKYNLINGGFIGFNTGLEFCVVGLDSNRAYAPACDAAGP
jgi:hypothetical protein